MSQPSKTAAPQNSAATLTVSKKTDGARESGSTRKDGQLSRDGRFRWSAGWGQWVPTGREIQELQQTDFLEAAKPITRHSPSCLCGDCMTAGQHHADYLKARSLW